MTEALQLLKTNQEKLISGLTHSKLDVNFPGGSTGMTLLHSAAMVRMYSELREKGVERKRGREVIRKFVGVCEREGLTVVTLFVFCAYTCR